MGAQMILTRSFVEYLINTLIVKRIACCCVTPQIKEVMLPALLA